jgi:hypothetical protein
MPSSSFSLHGITVADFACFVCNDIEVWTYSLSVALNWWVGLRRKIGLNEFWVIVVDGLTFLQPELIVQYAHEDSVPM